MLRTTWTMVSEAATLEAVKRSRALGDPTPITMDTLWKRVGEDMAAKPYKALGIDLLQGAREGREKAIDAFIAQSCTLQRLSVALVISPDRAVENSPLCCGMR